MNTTNLLVMEAGGVCDVLELEEISTSNEKTKHEEPVIITGKITVSP